MTDSPASASTLVDVLFQPLKLGAVEVPNRILMAPLTRNRSAEDGMPRPWAGTYYAQRAGAGLIISEATQISAMGKGYLGTPAIASDAHAEAWKPIVAAVHQAGGRFALQLWHVGRISHVSLLPPGEKPLAPSAIRAEGVKTVTMAGFEEVSEPVAMTEEQIRATLQDYVAGARRARAAGFDAVEIHGANGYLLDQFLRDGSNRREDSYGGSLENRMRFMLEVVDAVCAEVGADRTGIRIGPVNAIQGAADADPGPLFAALGRELQKRGLAWIHVAGTAPGAGQDEFVKALAEGDTPVIANGGFDAGKASAWIRQGWADAVAFGVPFLANPDLPERYRKGAPLNAPDKATFYGGDEKGYTDYPTLDAPPPKETAA